MKQLKKYFIGMLLLATLLFVTACGNGNNANNMDDVNGTEDTTNGDNTTDNIDNGADNGPRIDDYLFDTDGDGVYDHTDVDQDGLLEEIGHDANDIVDDLVNDVTGNGDTLMDGNDNAVEGNEEGTVNNDETVKNVD